MWLGHTTFLIIVQIGLFCPWSQVSAFLIKEGKELRVWARLFTQGAQNFDPKFNSTLQGKIVEALGQLKSKSIPNYLRNEFKAKAQHMRDVNAGRTLPPGIGKTNTGFNRFYVPMSLQAIWGYGCWCHFGEDLMVGQGQPVNQLDGMCKAMQLCFRCAAMDGDICPDENGGQEFKECDPKTQEFTAEFSKHVDDKSILADCQSSNPDGLCARNTCCCEMKFIAELMSLITSGVGFDSTYQHDNGWSYQENCTGRSAGPGTGNGHGGNGNTIERNCCGEYPSRVVYNAAEIECCAEDNNLFNPMSHVCCANGVGVHEAGMCP